VPEGGKYIITRDLGTYAIIKEVEAGRGSPHGGVYLSFQHCSEAVLREAFGPVIDRLAANGIDLTKMPVEVAPIAHYHMGGVVADAAMATGVPGLFAAGEAVGGANGANRLSGNAITEALVFGREAGRSAAAHAKTMRSVPTGADSSRQAIDLMAGDGPKDPPNTAEMILRLQSIMADHVGPLRTAAKLEQARDAIGDMQAALGERPFGEGGRFDLQRLEWLDLRNMLLVASVVAEAAHTRTESRGAHQREDHPGMLPEWQVNQAVHLSGTGVALTRLRVSPREVAAQ
jgi:succinate dehydrogenase/fumarate reductase flavoprotein subunit